MKILDKLVDSGNIEAPNRPELGFELNEDVVKEYRVKPY